MQAMVLAYTKTINHKYGRLGALFQGRFKAVHVAQDIHWDVLMEYIHRNPVEAGLAKSAEAWEFSSYRDYVGLRKGTLVEPSRMSSAGFRRMRALVANFGKHESDLISGFTLE